MPGQFQYENNNDNDNGQVLSQIAPIIAKTPAALAKLYKDNPTKFYKGFDNLRSQVAEGITRSEEVDKAFTGLSQATEAYYKVYNYALNIDRLYQQSIDDYNDTIDKYNDLLEIYKDLKQKYKNLKTRFIKKSNSNLAL